MAYTIRRDPMLNYRFLVHTEFNASVELALLNIQQQQEELGIYLSD